MKINLTKKQYEKIIQAMELTSFIYSTLADFTDDRFDKDADEIEDTEKYLLQYAKDFAFDKNMSDHGDLSTNEEYYTNLLNDLDEYDEQQLFENLIHKLGRRDFFEAYSEKEIEDMAHKHGGYLRAPISKFEDKYVEEFNTYGYDRLFIKEVPQKITKMKIESKDQIMKRRAEIESEIKKTLILHKSKSFLWDVQDTIFNEVKSGDIEKIVNMFNPGKDIEEMNEILQLVNNAWNYFPHKKLNGLSPAEKVLEYQNKDKK